MLFAIRLNYTSTKPPFYGQPWKGGFLLAKFTLEEFKVECELHRLSPRTIKGYYNSTFLFLTWLDRQLEITELEEIRPQHIKMFIQHLIKKPLTPSCINALLRCIRAYFRYAKLLDEYVSLLQLRATCCRSRLRNPSSAQDRTGVLKPWCFLVSTFPWQMHCVDSYDYSHSLPFDTWLLLI